MVSSLLLLAVSLQLVIMNPGVLSQESCMELWLQSIGIDEPSALVYLSILRSERVDECVLRQLSPEQLQELGISKYGHRILMYSSLHQENETDSSICKNGGTCNYFSPNDTFRCVCPTGLAGDLCEIVVDQCTAFPCLNGGTCIATLSGSGPASCQCLPGFTGDRCQYDHCHFQPCQNGGTCHSLPDGYNCSCTVGYQGRQCENAWLNQDNYALLWENVRQLSTQVGGVTQLFAYHQSLIDSYFRNVLDMVLSTQGLRFFKEWIDLEEANILQLRNFNIGSRQFIGAVSFRHGIIIYELRADSLVHVQTIGMSDSVVSFKHFNIGGKDFIASANFFDPQLQNVPSKLYLWNGTRFEKIQEFATVGARDVDFITIKNLGSFLAFSSYYNTMMSYDTPSVLYAWNAVSNLFVYYQSLPTTGAQKLHFFTRDSRTYLAVACEYDTAGNGVTNSTVFRWNGTYFDLHQLLPTTQARDLYPISIGCHTFLIAANFFDGSSHNILSKVYRFDKGYFVEHTALETKGAVSVEVFTIRSETFVAIANLYDEEIGSSTVSVIYKVDGPNFVPFQEIPTRAATYFHSFDLSDGCTALAVANGAGRAKVYKWTTTSLLRNSCCT